jgi:hypothetical protein
MILDRPTVRDLNGAAKIFASFPVGAPLRIAEMLL